MLGTVTIGSNSCIGGTTVGGDGDVGYACYYFLVSVGDLVYAFSILE
jgi:hypothetical protein